ncbi:MAG: hypothetical protein DMG64_11525 [Acidobacteria bacterium]|nr:MAG: hypothetical protein DMG63_06805 [Acidobacteriota bacterium]PYY02453.1 MAG: hypothetical protein DMG64_11525 [Acidobacteriota bacterium]PYY23724.1 MAG: hypothetical protein DMG62_07005 [Acidobacteriota bacterium]
MQYLLLIYQTELEWEKLDPPQQASVYREYRELIQQLAGAGKFIAGDELKPTTTATTVRVRDGHQTITDGPFAETKEQLAGYFLVNASDLNEAITIAAQIPSARDGSIEIRPVVAQEKTRQGSQ